MTLLAVVEGELVEAEVSSISTYPSLGGEKPLEIRGYTRTRESVSKLKKMGYDIVVAMNAWKFEKDANDVSIID